MRIDRNVAAFSAYRNLSATNVQLSRSLEKLPSGYRINRTAGDAAGMVKSESLRAEIRRIRQAIRNAQDGSAQQDEITLDTGSDLALASNDVFGTDLSGVDVSSDASAAITSIDAAINSRAELGAAHNRFDHVVASQSVAAENLSASESRVRDVDLAEEMVSFTRHQIRAQAGTVMPARANQIPATVLALIR